jgi:hypothetical protein
MLERSILLTRTNNRKGWIPRSWNISNGYNWRVSQPKPFIFCVQFRYDTLVIPVQGNFKKRLLNRNFWNFNFGLFCFNVHRNRWWRQWRSYALKRYCAWRKLFFQMIHIRDGPLDIWVGGWAKTQKKFAYRKNPEKKYRAQQTYWKKKSSKARGDFKNCNAIILKH